MSDSIQSASASALQVLRDFSRGPAAYSRPSPDCQAFSHSKSGVRFRISCDRRNALLISVSTGGDKPRVAEFRLRSRSQGNPLEDTLRNAYEKACQAIDGGVHDLEIERELELLRVFAFEVEDREWRQILPDEARALAYLKAASGHNGVWLISFAGSMRIDCLCSKCKFPTPIWRGGVLPPPLDALTSIPGLRAVRNGGRSFSFHPRILEHHAEDSHADPGSILASLSLNTADAGILRAFADQLRTAPQGELEDGLQGLCDDDSPF